MSQQPVDHDLRGRFGELRAQTEARGRTPAFRAVLDRASAEAAAQPALEVIEGGQGRLSRRTVVRTGAWVSAALAATLAGLLLFDRGPSADEQFEALVASYSADVSAGAWRSPTSGLLNVPGMELVRSVPSVGTRSDPSLRGAR